MVDLQTVCCMCGDVGFRDKLFRCNICRHRFQHQYCSNLYGELPEIQVCDWCQSEGKNSSHGVASNSKNSPVVVMAAGGTNRASEFSSGHKIKHQGENSSSSEKRKSTIPSPRHTRRYKLLKDVMC